MPPHPTISRELERFHPILVCFIVKYESSHFLDFKIDFMSLWGSTLLKFSIVWASVKCVYSKWDIKLEMLLNKEDPSKVKEHRQVHWLGTYRARAQTLNIFIHPPLNSLRFWPRTWCNCSTWDPTRHHLYAWWNVEALSLKLKSKVKLIEQACVSGWLLTNEKAPSFKLSISQGQP